jgi:uncharacterized membrane protein YraQ (UPF0718 family)
MEIQTHHCACAVSTAAFGFIKNDLPISLSLSFLIARMKAAE